MTDENPLRGFALGLVLGSVICFFVLDKLVVRRAESQAIQKCMTACVDSCECPMTKTSEYLPGYGRFPGLYGQLQKEK